MASTSSRTLRLLSLLQSHRHWPGAELADRLGVSARTLRRDVDRLRELGYPVDSDRGTAGGYRLAAGAALPPLVLDDEEAVALALGLQAAAASAVSGLAESSVRVLTKLVQVMPPRLRRRVDALQAMTVPATGADLGSSVDPAALTDLAQAGRDCERVEFTYHASDGRASARHVEPHRLVSLGRRWYLVGYDLGRHDWRTFRLDRLGPVRNTGVAFRQRQLPATDAATFVRAGMREQPQSYAVEVLVGAAAATAQSTVGRWGTVEPVDDDSCVLRMSTDSLDWAMLMVGAIGAEFTVRQPPELAAQVRDWSDRFGRAVGAERPGTAG